MPVWFYVLIAGMLVHITIVSVSIYLHRHLTHRSIGQMHPLLSHFFRLWLFLTTGMLRRQWVAVHRKHHAYVDVAGDPHSPQIFGLPKVFFLGAFLYRKAAGEKETLEKYGSDITGDWLEAHVYGPYSAKGLLLMLGIDLLFFGLPGFFIWTAQMVAIPLFGAGIINGFGHKLGYRNTDTPDNSRNILPVGILAVGEELHNNHHAFQGSAKFSLRWWELDMSWYYIRLFRLARLVGRVRYVRSAVLAEYPFLN